MKYVVEITETLVKHIIVDADNSGDAEIIANDAYNNEKAVLDYNDYFGADFKVLREADESDIADYMCVDEL